MDDGVISFPTENEYILEDTNNTQITETQVESERTSEVEDLNEPSISPAMPKICVRKEMRDLKLKYSKIIWGKNNYCLVKMQKHLGEIYIMIKIF